jgi:hypothetical protein
MMRKVSRTLGAALDDLLELGLQQALHGGPYVVDGVVDDVVELDLDALLLGDLDDTGVGPHLEAQDDRVGGRGQHDVRLRDGARGAVNELQLDLVGGELVQGLGQGLEGSLDIGLKDHVELLGAFLDPAGRAASRVILEEAASSFSRSLRTQYSLMSWPSSRPRRR